MKAFKSVSPGFSSHRSPSRREINSAVFQLFILRYSRRGSLQSLLSRAQVCSGRGERPALDRRIDIQTCSPTQTAAFQSDSRIGCHLSLAKLCQTVSNSLVTIRQLTKQWQRQTPDHGQVMLGAGCKLITRVTKAVGVVTSNCAPINCSCPSIQMTPPRCSHTMPPVTLPCNYRTPHPPLLHAR